MSEDMDTADVLNAAADYIQQHGLRKRHYGNVGGPMCTLGAISVAGGMFYIETRDSDAVRALYASLPPQSRGHFYSVDEWNDAKHRTKAQVLDALRSAAARLRGEGSK